MSSIDDRIVEMQFENREFEKNALHTMSTLDDLKDHLQFDGATDGFNDIEKAASGVKLGGIAGALDKISGAFSAMGVIGINVLSRLTQDALSLASNALSSVIDPIVAGGQKRSLAIEQAKFQFRGLGLDIDATMKAAKDAVYQTAYSLDEAATAAAQFGASGITAGNGLYESLRAIAGVAAQAGTGYSDIANIFTKVAGQGRLMGDDLLSMASRGVNAAAILAKALGKSEAEVRVMVSKGKIDFQTFSNVMMQTFGANAARANETFSGAMSNMRAAFARLGEVFYTPYFESQRKQFLAFTKVIDVFKDALVPVFNVITGIFNARADNLVWTIDQILNKTAFVPILTAAFKNLSKIIDSLYNIIKGAFEQIFPPNTIDTVFRVTAAINLFLASMVFSAESARKLKTTVAGFFAIISIGISFIKALFGAIFDLFGFIKGDASGSILDITANIGEWLISVDEAIKKGNIFGKVFEFIGEVIKAPITVFKGFIDLIKQLIDSFAKVNPDGFSEFAVKLKDRWEPIKNLFGGLGGVMEAFAEKLGTAAQKVKDWFTNLIPKGTGTGAGGSGKNPVTEFLQNLVDGIGAISFDQVTDAINTGLVSALTLAIIQFISKGKGVLSSLTGGFDGMFKQIGTLGGITDSIKGIFGEITNTFKAMQAQLRAKTLITIATAIAILTASVIALSFVDAERLKNSTLALSAMFVNLAYGMKVLSSIVTGKESVSMVSLSVAINLMATALLIMSAAVANMAKFDLVSLASGVGALEVIMWSMLGLVAAMNKINPVQLSASVVSINLLALSVLTLSYAFGNLAQLSWEQLAIGGIAFVGILGSLIATVAMMSKDPIKMLVAAKAISTMGAAILVISLALQNIADLKGESAVQALGVLALGLILLVAAAQSLIEMGPKVLVTAGAIFILAGALWVISQAIKSMAELKPDNVVAAAVAMAIIIGILAVALMLMQSPTVLLGAVALLIAAASLYVIAGALSVLGTIEWETIGKIAVVLLALAAAAFAFQFAAIGAVAMLVVASAMLLLAPALKLLGSISWDEIGRGMALLGAAIGIIALGGMLLIPASVGFLLMGAAILLIGTGVLLASIGITAFSVALAALVTVGQTGISVFTNAIITFADLIPTIAVKIGEGLVAMAVTIGQNAPSLIQAFVQLLMAMLAAVDEVVPEIIRVATHIIEEFINAMMVLLPLIIELAFTIIEAFLQSASDHIEDITTLAITLIANFINGIANGLPRLVQSGINLIISFINALAQGIEDNISRINAATTRLILAIADGIASGIRNNTAALRKAGEKIGSALLDGAKNLLGINSPSRVFRDYVMGSIYEGIEDGNDKNIGRANSAGEEIGDSMVSGIQKSILDIGKAIDTNLDAQPTIRPVLDLSSIKKNASQIGNLLSVPDQSISLDRIQTQAAYANTGYDDNMRARTDADGQVAGNVTELNYTQINNSPKAISAVETYRNTRNQLSTTKEALDKNANKT